MTFNQNILVYLIPIIMLMPLSISSAAQGSANAPWVGQSFNGIVCTGETTDHAQDYLTATSLRAVERVHFTQAVESLKKGATTKNPVDDLNYILNKYPNHHRALNTRINLQLNSGLYKWRHSHVPTAECYLQRAINFSPRDPIAQMLYGILLHRSEKLDDALTAYKRAEDLAPMDIQIKYNIGLVLYDMGQYEESANYASIVYKNDFPLLGLQNKLVRKEMWPID